MSSHMIRGRQLSRDTEHRMAMRRNLVQSLFEHGKVRTTMPKALEVRALAEKMITLARTGTLNARRKVISMIRDRRLVDEKQDFIETGPTRTVIQKLFNDIGPAFADRPGGYVRIIKTSKHRLGDAGDIVSLQLLTVDAQPKGTARRSAGLRRKRNERKHLFAAGALRKVRDAKKSSSSEAPAAADAGEGETKSPAV